MTHIRQAICTTNNACIGRGFNKNELYLSKYQLQSNKSKLLITIINVAVLIVFVLCNRGYQDHLVLDKRGRSFG